MAKNLPGKVYLGGVRVAEAHHQGIQQIAKRRGEGVSDTVDKALGQYIAADKRRRNSHGQQPDD